MTDINEAIELRTQVRLLGGFGDLLTDNEVDALLGLEGGNVHRAAAQALDSIAASEALLSKKITSQDLATDGPAVADALRAQAAALRKRADELEADSDGVWDVVEAPYGHQWRPELTEPTW